MYLSDDDINNLVKQTTTLDKINQIAGADESTEGLSIAEPPREKPLTVGLLAGGPLIGRASASGLLAGNPSTAKLTAGRPLTLMPSSVGLSAQGSPTPKLLTAMPLTKGPSRKKSKTGPPTAITSAADGHLSGEPSSAEPLRGGI